MQLGKKYKLLEIQTQALFKFLFVYKNRYKKLKTHKTTVHQTLPFDKNWVKLNVICKYITETENNTTESLGSKTTITIQQHYEKIKD